MARITFGDIWDELTVEEREYIVRTFSFYVKTRHIHMGLLPFVIAQDYIETRWWGTRQSEQIAQKIIAVRHKVKRIAKGKRV